MNKISCPYCGHKDNLEEIQNNKKLTCSKCKREFICYGGGYSQYSPFYLWEYYTCKIEDIPDIIGYLMKKDEKEFSEKYSKQKTLDILYEIYKERDEVIDPYD